MAITKPLLPAKPGYVEVEIDGRRTYRNATTGVLIDDEIPEDPNIEEDDINAMLVDHEFRLLLLELEV